MELFRDVFGNQVNYVYEEESFSDTISHVLVLCQYRRKWVLTNHQLRGYEFPGGKREADETLEEAAKRELYEETGAIVSSLVPVGYYTVEDPIKPFMKAVFYGTVERVEEKGDYFETNGPILLTELPDDYQKDDLYSFIMKDQVIPLSMAKIAERNLYKRRDDG